MRTTVATISTLLWSSLDFAKSMYVQTRGGWFSDRSACYLASGKPVLAQDTGFTQNYPVGEGLLSFTDIDEAVAGVVHARSPDTIEDSARAP